MGRTTVAHAETPQDRSRRGYARLLVCEGPAGGELRAGARFTVGDLRSLAGMLLLDGRIRQYRGQAAPLNQPAYQLEALAIDAAASLSAARQFGTDRVATADVLTLNLHLGDRERHALRAALDHVAGTALEGLDASPRLQAESLRSMWGPGRVSDATRTARSLEPAVLTT